MWNIQISEYTYIVYTLSVFILYMYIHITELNTILNVTTINTW